MKLRIVTLAALMVLASFCPVRAQVCAQAVNAAEKAFEHRDQVAEPDLLDASVAELGTLHCFAGCNGEGEGDHPGVSSGEREAMGQAMMFAYSPEGRRLSENQLKDAVHQWCVKTYGGD